MFGWPDNFEMPTELAGAELAGELLSELAAELPEPVAEQAPELSELPKFGWLATTGSGAVRGTVGSLITFSCSPARTSPENLEFPDELPPAGLLTELVSELAELCLFGQANIPKNMQANLIDCAMPDEIVTRILCTRSGGMPNISPRDAACASGMSAAASANFLVASLTSATIA